VQETTELKVVASAKDVHCPALVMYGTTDRSVTEDEREELVKALYKKEIYLIGGGDHNLTKPDQIDMVIGKVIGWVKDC
jgi:pimeloyl-ACP methyl ester carboxylesterase